MSRAWVAALQAALDGGGRLVNLVASWPGDADDKEDEGVRSLIDKFLASRPTPTRASGTWARWPMETVANTIFPSDLYFDELGDDALREFSELYLEGREIARSVSPEGEYCERLVAWSGPDGPINQLLDVGAKLRSYAEGRSRFRSVYEVAVADPSVDLRTYMPGRNGSPYGFPCLSHISLTVVDNAVNLTALYRNQHLVRKAFGNYLGLNRLARALCHHASLDLGEIAVVATHADAEIGQHPGFGKSALEVLLSDARTLLDG